MKTPNFYIASALDRVGHRRREPEWIAEQLSHPETRFVAVWRGQNLVVAGAEGPAALLLPPEAVALEGDPVLLGLQERRTYFALDLSHREQPLEPLRVEAAAEFIDLRRVGPLLGRDEGAILA